MNSYKHNCVKDPDVMMTPKQQQLEMREIGYHNTKQQVNSEFIFKQKDLKKKTKGYDLLTGEKDKAQAQVKKDKDKSDAKRREAYNKKLYRDRLKTKWDRSW